MLRHLFNHVKVNVHVYSNEDLVYFYYFLSHWLHVCTFIKIMSCQFLWFLFSFFLFSFIVLLVWDIFS